MSLKWTDEQFIRLKELQAPLSELEKTFADKNNRNREFQKIEKQLAFQTIQAIKAYAETGGRPKLNLLEEQLAQALVKEGFSQVTTPIIMSKVYLERMGVDADNALVKQVFWLDNKTCLRPMLAPNLYYLLVDLLRILPHPVSIFEIGPCFRKESQGSQHSGEFTMLNLVEMGLPLEERAERIKYLSEVVVKASGLKEEDCQLTVQDSGVYGETIDVEGPNGLELASTAQGPHPLDVPWGIDVPWVGIGFGLERLLLAQEPNFGLARNARSLTHINGFKTNV